MAKIGSWFLRPLSWSYQELAAGHRLLYEKDILPTVHLPTPVVSVGNLTVGGTGKTPFINFILKRYSQIHFGVVSKSYKALASRPEIVNVDKTNFAQFFGDEPSLLATKNPNTPIYVGPSKSETARLLYKQEKIDCLLIDDGFQHHRLHKTKNILLLDASISQNHYRPLPEGRLREKFCTFRKADLIVVTKMESAKKETLDFFKQSGVFDLPTLFASSQFGPPKDFLGVELALSKDDDIMIFCGLASPQSFVSMVKKLFDRFQQENLHQNTDEGLQKDSRRQGNAYQNNNLEFPTFIFPDHHQYSLEDLINLQRISQQKNIQKILTTEKDAIKLRFYSQHKQLAGFFKKIVILPLEIVINEKLEALDEIFCS